LFSFILVIRNSSVHCLILQRFLAYYFFFFFFFFFLLLLTLFLLLLLSILSLSLSPLCQVLIHIFLRQTMSLGNSVSAILSLLFMVSISIVPVLTLLYFYVSTFRSMCAVPSMAVFCISFTSWFPGMLLMYFQNDFEMVPIAPIITGITLVFTYHKRCISIVRSTYFKILSDSFLITFLSPGIATSIYIHVLDSLSRILKSGLLLGMVLSVFNR